MANEEHLANLKRGVKTWNRWRKDAPFVEPDLRNADLTCLDFSGIDLQVTDLRGANLFRATFVDAVIVASTFENANLDGANFKSARMTVVGFQDAKLRNSNFENATIKESQFIRADLREAKFYKATIDETSFDDADLSSAKFLGASFSVGGVRRAKLVDADLASLKLDGILVEGADFARAISRYTLYLNMDLSGAKGLEKMVHSAPSEVGINTIFKSRGRIPESFLRGCGVPENLISYIPSLVNSEAGIQFYPCFISYSSKDEEFARRLHGRMRDAHLRVWFAGEDMKSGEKLHEQIETAIRVHEKLLVVLSEASMQSEWVMTELRIAHKNERQRGERKLFPVRLVDMETIKAWKCFDADSGKDLAVELREYFIPDFSQWKEHGQFEAAFARLLEDLRSEESPR